MATAHRRLSTFPAFHKVEGRRVVVVGGGGEAAAKLRLLSETSAVLVVFAPVLEDEAAADVVATGALHEPRWPAASDLEGAALVFAATGDLDQDSAVRALGKAAGIPVNVVDRPDLCDFYVPALVNRAPLAVAISTEGAAPVLARHVRARIESLLAPAIGDLAHLAEGLRERVAERIPTSDARRRFWAHFFTGPAAAKVLAGQIEGIDAEADAAIDASASKGHAGHVSLVGAGPGAEDLLTLRAVRLLQEADVIVYDKLVPEAVVAMGRRDALRIYVGKAKGMHAASQDEINAILVREARDGRRIVRLKSGDPLIFGRAGEEMAALRAAGIPFDIVPGVTAAIAAAAENEIPLTLRDVASTFVLATGHDMRGDTLPEWAGLALAGSTIAVYMGRSVASKVAARLIENGLAASTPVAVIENASRVDRKAYAGRLDELARIADRPEIDGPVVIIVGRVVAESALGVAPLPLAAMAA
ncbi:uroporphyrin-III C-methyltransferase / precorrin-2 dehydrogenase / sirohydrochlorin ferrochelatase [Kaistia soli DSM 19436]|uniref:Uroporphyrin-III C-methyltransferase / precorrin-2 dehydrogenase / sirohydrochlorin ferrochelatase n=1 Tax=Kaistia soli DSM 19436 TaxID=1122133 RepID=A0A1M4XV40_9HYPH|nr:siroheme synthase CysG [Kaistia soli]SHE97444.1 uroporphyrin-III C-methyltransferase / precorrin-2 dehydrogenase / sirohydrochlorin ferrochelatase [Kaistia soli DSM 19436]